MIEKSLFLLVTLNLVVILSGLGSVPLYIYYRFPHLDRYQDTTLMDQSLYASYTPSSCQLTMVQRQTLQTTESKGDIWRRLLASRPHGRSRIHGHGDETDFQTGNGSPISMASRASFAHGRSFNSLSVLNRFAFTIPERFCGWLPQPANQGPQSGKNATRPMGLPKESRVWSLDYLLSEQPVQTRQ